MKIIFSEHALERMEERNIEEKDVIWALFAPDSYKSTFKDRIQIQKKIDSKTLEIIYLESGDTMTVITSYWL